MKKIVCIVVLLAVGYGAYAYAYANKAWPFAEVQKSETLLPIDISKWKTYRNEKFGFEFKYPQNFHLEEQPDYYDEILIYNYDYKYYPEYKGTASLTRYLNFHLSLRPNSVYPDVMGVPKSGIKENVQSGSANYTKVKQDIDRREAFYFIHHPMRNEYMQFAFRPTIDKKDIGALATEPGFLDGINEIQKNPEFLGDTNQNAILTEILSSLKLFKPIGK